MPSDSVLSNEVAHFLRQHTSSSTPKPTKPKPTKPKPKPHPNSKKPRSPKSKSKPTTSNARTTPTPQPKPKPKPKTKPKAPSPPSKLPTSLLLGNPSTDGTSWFTLLDSLPTIKGGSTVKHKRSREQIGSVREKTAAVLERETVRFTELKEGANDAEYEHMQRVIETGTLSDKIAGLTVLISNAAIYHVSILDRLLAMVERKGKREAKLAAEALKELFQTHLLPPDRELVAFEDRPVLKSKASEKHLLIWLFEDQLKQRYLRFVRGVEGLTFDNLDHVKRFAIRATCELLKSRCEQEQLLLMILVNKLADTQRKTASDVVFLLHKLVAAHPNMRMVIIQEIEQYLFMPTRAMRARYNGIIFLNQIELVRDQDVPIARKLLDIYVRIFDTIFGSPTENEGAKEKTTQSPKRKAKGKRRHRNGKKPAKSAAVAPTLSSSRILSALLTGVNRAYPYAKSSGDELAKQVETLFKISHQSSFNTATQALMVLLHMMKSSNTVSDRFYRALYAHLLHPDFHTSSKQTLFLNLIYRALKADVSLSRSRAFIKRLFQIACIGSAQFAAGTLFLVSKIIQAKPELATMLGSVAEEQDPSQAAGNTEEEEEEERKNSRPSRPEPKILIVGDTSNAKDSTKQKEPQAQAGALADGETEKKTVYDATKRDPLHAGTGTGTIAWELAVLSQHYHPTVRTFVETMVSSPKGSIKYEGDPLRDFSNTAFLDRFVYRNPRKKDMENIKNASVFGTAGRAGRQGKTAVAAAVNSPAFLLQRPDNIASNERFFYQFFQQKANLEGKSLVQEMMLARERAKLLKRKENSPFAEFEEDEEEEAFAEKLAEKLLQESGGGRAVDEDLEDDIDFDYSSDEGETKASPAKRQKTETTLKGNGDEDSEDDDDEGIMAFAEESSDSDEPGDAFGVAVGQAANSADSSVFASAEDYAQYLDEDSEPPLPKQTQKRKR